MPYIRVAVAFPVEASKVPHTPSISPDWLVHVHWACLRPAVPWVFFVLCLLVYDTFGLGGSFMGVASGSHSCPRFPLASMRQLTGYRYSDAHRQPGHCIFRYDFRFIVTPDTIRNTINWWNVCVTANRNPSRNPNPDPDAYPPRFTTTAMHDIECTPPRLSFPSAAAAVSHRWFTALGSERSLWLRPWRWAVAAPPADRCRVHLAPPRSRPRPPPCRCRPSRLTGIVVGVRPGGGRGGWWRRRHRSPEPIW